MKCNDGSDSSQWEQSEQHVTTVSHLIIVTIPQPFDTSGNDCNEWGFLKLNVVIWLRNFSDITVHVIIKTHCKTTLCQKINVTWRKDLSKILAVNWKREKKFDF